MKVTECLNTEHGVFLTQLDVLDRMLKEKASGDELRAAMLTVAEAVEKHREVEEKILYPAILREFGEDFAPIRVMEAEHKDLEGFIRGVESREGDIAASVRGFVDLLRQHIGKEIQVLFPMAEGKIPAADLEEMACRCVEHHHRAAGVNPSGPQRQ